MNATKQVLVLRTDLNMRKGKMVSQGAHAALVAFAEDARVVVDKGQRYLRIPLNDEKGTWYDNLQTTITLGVPDETALMDVFKQAEQLGLPCALIRDAGLTEFKGVPTYTSVGIGPADAEIIDRITGGLPLL